MKIMCVHAHFDDFEFVASGLFTLWKRRLGAELQARVIVCTDGKAGHHFRTRDETGAIRLKEQAESAAIGGYDFQPLIYPDGTPPREACLQVSAPFLAALWKAIRDFEPDYLFCPPLPADPLAGIHIDHVAVAEAVRKVAYMINVPHAFTPEYPADEATSEPKKVPVIVNLYDGYMAGENAFDLAVDVEEAFHLIADMTFCHQSQIMEWLPWVGRHRMSAPRSKEQWSELLRDRYGRQNRELGFDDRRAREFFTFTAWGTPPDYEKVLNDFPGIDVERSNLGALDKRLKRWSA